MSTDQRKNKLLEQLKALKLFPNNNEIRKLRARAKRQLEKITQVEQQKAIPIARESIDRKALASQRKSIALKKHFRYLRLIRDNFPQFSFAQIRKQFSQRRKGQDSDISDAVWQNPSP